MEFEFVTLLCEERIELHTVIGQGGAPPEFAAQQCRGGPFAVALVTLAAAGSEVSIPAQLTDVDPETVESATPCGRSSDASTRSGATLATA